MTTAKQRAVARGHEDFHRGVGQFDGPCPHIMHLYNAWLRGWQQERQAYQGTVCQMSGTPICDKTCTAVSCGLREEMNG